MASNASTFTRTSPAPACGSSTSRIFNTSGPPNSVKPTAFIRPSERPGAASIFLTSETEWGVLTHAGGQRNRRDGPRVGAIRGNRKPIPTADSPLADRAEPVRDGADDAPGVTWRNPGRRRRRVLPTAGRG